METAEQRHQRLEHMGSDLKAEQERVERLNAELATIKQDRSKINASLVETAQKIQGLERAISASEKRLAGYEATESKIRASLAKRHDVIAELLAALQRMGRNPPPALLVEPENALKAVRSAILLGAVLPEFAEEAKFLAQELDDLVKLRAKIAAEISANKTEVQQAAAGQQKLDALLILRRKDESASEEELVRASTRAAQLANDVKSLSELIERSEKEIEAARRAAEQAASAEAARVLMKDSATIEAENIAKLRSAKNPDERTVAFLGPADRKTPAIAFDKAAGFLPLPVSGETLRVFGDKDRYGLPNHGLLIATRKQAIVTSPADGFVVYAGPFRSYGLIVIINAGSGYHILLAGLSQSSVEIGQFVPAGAPVGKMGDTRLSAATAIDVASSEPVLYVEFRKNGVTVDPSPWWAHLKQKV